MTKIIILSTIFMSSLASAGFTIQRHPLVSQIDSLAASVEEDKALSCDETSALEQFESPVLFSAKMTFELELRTQIPHMPWLEILTQAESAMNSDKALTDGVCDSVKFQVYRDYVGIAARVATQCEERGEADIINCLTTKLTATTCKQSVGGCPKESSLGAKGAQERHFSNVKG